VKAGLEQEMQSGLDEVKKGQEEMVNQIQGVKGMIEEVKEEVESKVQKKIEGVESKVQRKLRTRFKERWWKF
ncbi:hypothetical protein AVEN_266419-2-1, partial [Araneus ventricosus]